MQTINHEGRVYEITKSDKTSPALAADMMRRGWDGSVYYGISEPIGRQRKTFAGLFYRNPKTGEFTKAI